LRSVPRRDEEDPLLLLHGGVDGVDEGLPLPDRAEQLAALRPAEHRVHDGDGGIGPALERRRDPVAHDDARLAHRKPLLDAARPRRRGLDARPGQRLRVPRLITEALADDALHRDGTHATHDVDVEGRGLEHVPPVLAQAQRPDRRQILRCPVLESPEGLRLAHVLEAPLHRVARAVVLEALDLTDQVLALLADVVGPEELLLGEGRLVDHLVEEVEATLHEIPPVREVAGIGDLQAERDQQAFPDLGHLDIEGGPVHLLQVPRDRHDVRIPLRASPQHERQERGQARRVVEGSLENDPEKDGLELGRLEDVDPPAVRHPKRPKRR
jgi:hypothetical protein